MDPQNQTTTPIVPVDDTVQFMPAEPIVAVGPNAAPDPPSPQNDPIPDPIPSPTSVADPIPNTPPSAPSIDPVTPQLVVTTPEPNQDQAKEDQSQSLPTPTTDDSTPPALPTDEPKLYEDHDEPEGKSLPLDSNTTNQPKPNNQPTEESKIKYDSPPNQSSQVATQSPSLLDPSRFYPIGEAAEMLGVSIDTLRRWEQKGQIQAERSKGQLRRFSGKVLQDYLQHQASEDRLISVSEAAKELGVSIQTLRRWDKSSRLKAERAPDGARMYRLRMVRDLKANGLPVAEHDEPKKDHGQKPSHAEHGDHPHHHQEHPKSDRHNDTHEQSLPVASPITENSMTENQDQTRPGQEPQDQPSLMDIQSAVDNLATSALGDRTEPPTPDPVQAMGKDKADSGQSQNTPSARISPFGRNDKPTTYSLQPTTSLSSAESKAEQRDEPKQGERPQRQFDRPRENRQQEDRQQPERSYQNADQPAVDLSPITRRLDQMESRIGNLKKQLEDIMAKIDADAATLNQLKNQKPPTPTNLFHTTTSPATAMPPEFDGSGLMVKPGIEDHGDATTGKSIMHKGTNKVVIKSHAAIQNSTIYLTAVTPTIQQLAVPIIIQNEGFAVATAQPVSVDLTFNWLVVN